MTKKEFFGLLERYEKGLATEEEIELFESFFQSFQKSLKEHYIIKLFITLKVNFLIINLGLGKVLKHSMH